MSDNNDAFGDDSNDPFLENNRQNSSTRINNSKKLTESHHYELDESEVWKHHQLQRHFQDQGHWWTFAKRKEVRQWMLTLLTGIVCGFVAVFVTFTTKSLNNIKFSIFNSFIEQEVSGTLFVGAGFVFLFLFNLAAMSIAVLSTIIEPMAAGSGIPEVKCFLNGLNVPNVVSPKTLVTKAVGIVFACVSGLPLGKEGPMVHICAVVAAIVSQGVYNPLSSDFKDFQDFRNDREKRDFVACGAAAGIASAFGAPIGGVLFSLEEGASFWSTKLTWRCFFCAMTTVFTVYAINTANIAFGHTDSTAMFSFGEFHSLQGEEFNYSVWEMSLFILLGLTGGLVGACYVDGNSYIASWRSYIDKTSSNSSTTSTSSIHPLFSRRLVWEAVLVVSVMSTISFFLPLFFGRCSPLSSRMSGWGDQEKTLVKELVPLYCPRHSHYNELASLYLTDSDTAIKQLFHFREVGNNFDSTFSSLSLFLFFLPYIFMACITNGVSVPQGLFVPSLMSGAALGRLIGHLLHQLDHARGTFADSGTYALMGAAAVTSGVTRMTISLTVMVLEATGDMQYVLPLMITVMTSRMIGNVFNKGVYDIYVERERLEYLDEEESVSQLAQLHDLTVAEIMTKRPICLRPVVVVGELYDMLSAVTHHCFPIVEEHSGSVLVGTIPRKVLCILIKHKAFAPLEVLSLAHKTASPGNNSDINHEGTTLNLRELLARKDVDDNIRNMSPIVNWGTLECVYPDYPDISSLSISESERSALLDLRPYMDCAPFALSSLASIQRAYRMFRTLGLRHLCVINMSNQVVGMLTRKNLTPEHLMGKSSHHTITRQKPRRKNSDYLQPTIELNVHEL